MVVGVGRPEGDDAQIAGEQQLAGVIQIGELFDVAHRRAPIALAIGGDVGAQIAGHQRFGPYRQRSLGIRTGIDRDVHLPRPVGR